MPQMRRRSQRRTAWHGRHAMDRSPMGPRPVCLSMRRDSADRPSTSTVQRRLRTSLCGDCQPPRRALTRSSRATLCDKCNMSAHLACTRPPPGKEATARATPRAGTVLPVRPPTLHVGGRQCCMTPVEPRVERRMCIEQARAKCRQNGSNCREPTTRATSHGDKSTDGAAGQTSGRNRRQ